MNFKDYHNKQINETNVSGGATSAFGPAGGSSSGGALSPVDAKYADGDTRIPAVLGAKKKKKKRKKSETEQKIEERYGKPVKKMPTVVDREGPPERVQYRPKPLKKKRKAKKLKNKNSVNPLGETGRPTIGPVQQSRNFPEMLALPANMKGSRRRTGTFNEALPALAALAGKGALVAGKGALAAGKAAAGAAGKATGALAKAGAAGIGAGIGGAVAGKLMNGVQPGVPVPTKAMSPVEIDTMVNGAITPMMSLDKDNFNIVYNKMTRMLQQMKAEKQKQVAGTPSVT